MGRKNRQKTMAKKKFKNVVCSVCGLCADGLNPKFCYNFLYKKNPGTFMDAIKPKLISQRTFLAQIKDDRELNANNSMVAMCVFRSIFCVDNVCQGCDVNANTIQPCLAKFRQQETNVYKRIQNVFGPKPANKKQQLTKKQKKALKRAKNTPKVTIFMSENEEFKAEVKRIIENNFKQPD